MKLLNTRTIQLEDFLDSSLPSYAILSHRWQKEELSFQDLKPKFAQSLTRKPGYAKIYHFCQTALRDGFDYGWADTTCIDKRSSAELSEAINSMFHWYQEATTCYVYMDTVPSANGHGEMHRAQFQAFQHSEWFLRGWTLQELLAPEHVIFLDCTWTKFGTKDSLAHEISLITNIEERFLIDNSRFTLGGYLEAPPCVATKMSWASMRTTSRKEDMAYCLLGLFDINMPLLYGEGEKAFARLQEEIIRKTDDETIFAWAGGGRSLLARSPKSFVNCQDFQLLNLNNGFDRPPYSITNRGLEFQGELIEMKMKFAGHSLLPLRVSLLKAGRKVVCAIAVTEVARRKDPGSVVLSRNTQGMRLQRCNPNAIYECFWKGEGSASSIKTITRVKELQSWMENDSKDDRKFDLDGDVARRLDVTNNYWLPTASDRSTTLVPQLLYLSLNEPLDSDMFRVSKGMTAASVAGTEDKQFMRKVMPKRGTFNVDSSGMTHDARSQREHTQRPTSQTIYVPTAKKLIAESEGSQDEHGRHVEREPASVRIVRLPSRRKERRSYG